jgi:CheY-like chemotaxis protein
MPLATKSDKVTKAKLMKLLIVDDDERIRRMIKTIVADASSIICECSDGEQACACYAEHQPDWVLMDIMMPLVDGITATRRIRANDPTARVIIVTAHNSQAMREEARGAGACGYVLKENLLELREILNKPEALTSPSG